MRRMLAAATMTILLSAACSPDSDGNADVRAIGH